MFKPVPMMRLSAVVLECDERSVLRTLGNLGVIQLTRSQTHQAAASLVARDLSNELARCHRTIARTQELRNALTLPSPSEPVAPPLELSLAQAEEQLLTLETHAGNLLKHHRQLMERLDELKMMDGRLTDYRGLEVPLDQPDETSFLHFVTGTLPPENLAKLQTEIGDGMALLPLPERNGRQPLLIMTARQNRPALENSLQQSGFQRDVLPVVYGATTDTLSEDNLREQVRLAAKLNEMNLELRALANESDQPLAAIEMVAETERRLLEAGQTFSRTESAILLSGWVPQANARELEGRLQEITGGRCVVETSEPEETVDELVPILLRHPRWLRPFEMLVAAYGLPLYRELEPTLFVAVSYLLMFGMMFGDAGHGLVLALGGLALLLANRRRSRWRDAGLLLLFAGGASMIAGVIYGSYFGLPQFKPYALWHDPLEGDPMKLMLGAIGMGVVMISLGLVMNIINRFRHGDVIGALLDRFGVAGAVFYWGALLMLAKPATVQARGLFTPVLLLLAAMAIAWLLKEPLRVRCARRRSAESDDAATVIVESFAGAFEGLISYLANTISFVRLAAYAMSHAALLLAAFMIAANVKQLSIGGNVLSVLVIILGNAVAIALEGVVAAVQALRLEYYEFFGKFFAGGGRPFEPFRL